MTYYLQLNDKDAELIEADNVLSAVSSAFNTPAQAVSENLTLAHPFLMWFNDYAQDSGHGDLNTTASAILKAFAGSNDDSLNVHAPVAITGLFVPDTEHLSTLSVHAIRVLRGKFGVRVDLESRPAQR